VPQKITVIILLPCLLMLMLAIAGGSADATQPKLHQVIYITVSKACGCTMDRCQAGDRVVERAFAGDKRVLVKRIDYSTDKETALIYIKKYRLIMPPSLIFLDAQGNLLWRAEGEMDYKAVVAKLKELEG